MWLIGAAMRRPITIMVGILGIIMAGIFSLATMKQDIFPDLNMPCIYVVQGYGGMAPDQMEGYLVSTYEVHFFYVPGVEHIESKSIQNVSLMKIYFHQGTNMAEALSTTVAMIDRARSLMPAGTLAPFVFRFDAGSLPVGQLVLASPTRTTDELQDLAFVRVRPQLGSIPGASSPPPEGGNARTIVISVDANRLRQFNISGDDIVNALASGNVVTPAGNVRIGNFMRIAPINTDLPDIRELDYLPIRMGAGPTVLLRDLATVSDSSDILAGYALYNGRRTVYEPVVKRADASTVSVVNALKEHLPRMRELLPKDVSLNYEFDQSKYVTQAIADVVQEAALGAILPGLMILLFLRDIRSTIIVVTTIPCALLSASIWLMLSGQTINIQTLSGLALAIGILVDEATVNIENIHVHLVKGEPIRRAVFEAGVETMVPRFLAMMSVLAVFVPSFFMVGVTKALFVPLSLAVGFAMISSFLLSSTLVPVMAVWLVRKQKETEDSPFKRFQKRFAGLVRDAMPFRLVIVPAYLVVATLISTILFLNVGRELFPNSETDEFQLRIKAPTGTRVEVTEQVVAKTMEEIKKEAGPGNVEASLGYAGQQAVQFALSSVFLWTSGPHEAVMDVRLRSAANIDLDEFKDRLRKRFAVALPDITYSFEPGDIVSQIMNMGQTTPIAVMVQGPNLVDNKIYSEKLRAQLLEIPYLRDLQYGQAQDYPTVDIHIDRELAGQFRLTPQKIGDSLVPATSSSRYILTNFWMDRKTGVGYQVQVQVPQDQINSLESIKTFPTMTSDTEQHPLVGDVASVSMGSCVGEYDRFNMLRYLSLTANIRGSDLGQVGSEVEKAIARCGAPPRGVVVEQAGQVPMLKGTFQHLFLGLGLAVMVIFLMLTSYFQSPRLGLIVLSTAPAIICGVLFMLWLTHTSLNVESFMGAIMSLGVGVSNAILLVAFSEKSRLEGKTAEEAALTGAEERLRPILMTSIAMISGMVPMALALGSGGQQSASLGRAVIGGLTASTITALTILPLVFTIIQGRTSTESPSLHPEDRGE